ncbi:MAG: Gfo/Idh/MocA family oxidoreductase [Cyclobacteriaceae bacterium]|nr:Gfo/Idh/MocA family oxidoreductase [Cyclobacteriaceae bacterium]
MLAKIKTIIKLILQRLKVLGKEQNEYYQFKRIKFIESVKLEKTYVRAHIVGCGAMGRQIAHVINSIEGWQIVSAFDKNLESISKLSLQLNKQIAASQNLDQFLGGVGKEDVLIIATTANSHYDLASQALKSGIKKIFIEKPICTSLADAESLIQLAKLNSATVYVDHLRRWTATAESIDRLIRTDSIGKIITIHYVFGRAGFAMIGTHIFDYCRMLAKSNIMEVRGLLDSIHRPTWRGAEFIDPSGSCEVKMENGIKVIVDLSDNLEIQQDFLIIFCERGRLEVDQRNERIRMIGPSGVEWQKHYPWKEMVNYGLGLSLSELSRNIPPRCSLIDGKAALEATIAVHESSKIGGNWIQLPLRGKIINEKFSFA